jgi:hypothetical protein
MLNPSPITDAIAAALKSIPELDSAMGGQIVPFHYRLGAEHRLKDAVYKMPAPSMLVAWEGTQGGNFDGQTIWKHRWGIYFRMGNAAGVVNPIGYEDLWWIVCNKPAIGAATNIRYVQLYPGLDIMDTPSVSHLLDEDLMDLFRGEFVIPEIGDN